MKMSIKGLYGGVVAVEADRECGYDSNFVKVLALRDDKICAVSLGPAEAIALADALLGAAKYITSKSR